ncbi:hypothetical protein LCGC14_2677720, partial [marine sediment metagenome]
MIEKEKTSQTLYDTECSKCGKGFLRKPNESITCPDCREEIRKRKALTEIEQEQVERVRAEIEKIVTPPIKNYVLGYIHNLSQLEIELKRNVDHI